MSDDTPQSSSHWQRRMTIIVSLLGLLVVSVLMVPRLGPVRSSLRSEAVALANESLAGSLEIESLTALSWTTLIVEGITVRDSRGNVVARVGEARAKWSLTPLFSSTAYIDMVELDRVEAVVRRYPDGVLNVTEIAKPTEDDTSEPPAWIVILERAALSDSNVVFWDETVAGPAPADLGELEPVAMRAARTRSGEKAETLGVVHAAGIEFDLSARVDLEGPLSVDLSRFEMETGIDLVGGETKVSASDARVRFDDPYVSLELGILNAAGLASVGDVSVQSKLGDAVTASAVIGALSVEPEFARAFAGQDVIASTVRGQFRAGYRDDRVDLSGSLLVSDAGSVEIAGTLEEASALETSKWSVSVDGQGLELSKWSALAAPVERGSVRVAAAGEGFEPKTATGQGTVWVADVLVDKYTINEALAELRWANEELVVDVLRGRSPYATVDGRGAYSLDGQFATSLDIEARDQLSEVTSGALTFGDDAGGFVSLSANGRLDLEATKPARMLVDGEIKARWDLQDFSAEDITVVSSKGSIDARVDKAVGDGSRRLRADVEASGRKVSGLGYRVSSFALEVDANSRFRPPYADLSDFTQSLGSRVRARVGGLSGPGLALSSANLSLDTRDQGSSTFGYGFDAQLSQLRSGTTRIASARANLNGSVTIGSGERLRDVLKAIRVKGTAGVDGVEADGATVRVAAVELDVRGPTQDLQGRVELAARGANASQYDFEQLVAILELTGGREFQIDADGTQGEGRPKKFDATILGSYAADLKSYTIREVRFSAGDQQWSFSDGFSFSPEAGEYRFDDVTVSHGDQSIRLDGTFRQGRDQDLRVEAKDLSISDIRQTLGLEPGEDEPQIRGKVSLNGSLTGTSRQPEATFDIWVRDLYIDEQGPFDAHLVGRYGEARLVLESLEAWAFEIPVLTGTAEIPFEGSLDGKGEVVWSAPFLFDLEVPQVELARFHNAMPALEELGARGVIGLSLRLDGRLEAPEVDFKLSGEGLSVEGELDKKPLALGPYDLRLTSDYEPGARGAAGKLRTTGALDEAGGGDGRLVNLAVGLAVDAPGWLADLIEARKVDWMGRVMALPYDLKASVDAFDLRKVGLDSMTKADAEGIVDVEIAGKATVGDPVLTLEAKLNDFGWNRYRDVVVDLSAKLQNDVISLNNFRLEWDRDEILTGRGKVPFPTGVIAGRADLEDLPVDLSIALSRLPIAKFQAVDYTFASVRGSVGGFVTISGRLSDPTLSSRLSIVDTMFADRSTGTVAVDLTASDNRVDLVAQVCQGPLPTVDLRASVPLNLDLPAVARGEDIFIDGALSGRLVANRVSVASLVPEKILDRYLNEVRGAMSADVKLAGTTEVPRLLGDLRVEDAEIFLPDYGRRFSGIDLDVSFRPDGVRVKELEVRDGRGRFEATGKLDMVAFKPEDLRFRMRAEELSTAGFTPLPLFLTSDVDIRGVVDNGLIDGDIDVSSLEVIIPETASGDAYETELSPDIVFASDIKRRGTTDGFLSLDEISEQTETTGQPFARFTVEVARDSWVRHPIGDVNLTGSLDIEVAPSGATIGGEIETLRGDFELLGKRFDLRRGVITFTGANPPNPRIDVEAVYLLDRSITESIGQPTSGKPRVIVEVAGSVSVPELNLSSDPQMPEDDIIYVLVTGRPPDQTGVGEREGVANTALSAASGIFSGILQQKLQGTIPVDVLRVESGDEGFGDYRVEAGKYLTESLFLSLQYQFGAARGENATTVSIEYRFAPRWTLEFEAGDEANGEANIFWDVY